MEVTDHELDQLVEFTIEHLANRHDAIGVMEDGKDWRCHRYQGGITETSRLLRRHFDFETPFTVGLYTASETWTTQFAAFDIDDHAGTDDGHNWNICRAICKELIHQGATPLIENSNGAGGYHIWIRFSEPVSCGPVYRWLQSVLQKCVGESVGAILSLVFDPKSIETFPKQEVRTTSGLGNFIRLPGIHPKRGTISRFKTDDGWIPDCPDQAYDFGTAWLSLQPLDVESIDWPEPEVHSPSKSSNESSAPVLNPAARQSVAWKPGGLVETAEEAMLAQYPNGSLVLPFGFKEHISSETYRTYTRPGKTTGTSITWDYDGSKLFHVFSSNIEGLEQGESYRPWRMWTFLSGFGTDYVAAARHFLGEKLVKQIEQAEKSRVKDWVDRGGDLAKYRIQGPARLGNAFNEAMDIWFQQSRALGVNQMEDGRGLVLWHVMAINRLHYDPPLEESFIRKQVDDAYEWVRAKVLEEARRPQIDPLAVMESKCDESAAEDPEGSGEPSGHLDAGAEGMRREGVAEFFQKWGIRLEMDPSIPHDFDDPSRIDQYTCSWHLVDLTGGDPLERNANSEMSYLEMGIGGEKFRIPLTTRELHEPRLIAAAVRRSGAGNLLQPIPPLEWKDIWLGKNLGTKKKPAGRMAGLLEYLVASSSREVAEQRVETAEQSIERVVAEIDTYDMQDIAPALAEWKAENGGARYRWPIWMGSSVEDGKLGLTRDRPRGMKHSVSGIYEIAGKKIMPAGIWLCIKFADITDAIRKTVGGDEVGEIMESMGFISIRTRIGAESGKYQGRWWCRRKDGPNNAEK